MFSAVVVGATPYGVVSFFWEVKMDWTLQEYTYDTNAGTQNTIRWWMGHQSNSTIKLEVHAGEQQQSTPSEYRTDTDDYTEVFVRAIHKASGAFLWLSEYGEGIKAPVGDLTTILANLDGYTGDPKQAYHEL